jgi:hypothetical protein
MSGLEKLRDQLQLQKQLILEILHERKSLKTEKTPRTREEMIRIWMNPVMKNLVLKSKFLQLPYSHKDNKCLNTRIVKMMNLRPSSFSKMT